jgi:hypothetical protein
MGEDGYASGVFNGFHAFGGGNRFKRYVRRPALEQEFAVEMEEAVIGFGPVEIFRESRVGCVIGVFENPTRYRRRGGARPPAISHTQSSSTAKPIAWRAFMRSAATVLR